MPRGYKDVTWVDAWVEQVWGPQPEGNATELREKLAELERHAQVVREQLVRLEVWRAREDAAFKAVVMAMGRSG